MASAAFIDKVNQATCIKCGASIDVSNAGPLTDITCPSCGQPTTVPGQLDQYLLTKVLGQGSAGIVYQATDQQNQRDVAIKVFLKKKGEASSQRIEKCLAEAKAMRSFNHPNVVKIYSVAQKEQKPYIVIELLTGERLDRMIADRWLVEEAKGIKLGIDIAEGLKAIHDAGFAHLDVKPDNMQFDGQGTCKLLDYDTARSLQEIETQGAGLVGTPYYVAPEVIQREQVDFRADMYGLGSTLFHLLAQRPPFQGATSRDVVQERLKRRAIPLKDVRPDISQETSLVIAKMLEPQPRDRHRDYDELLADLRRALNAAQWDAQLKAGSASPQPKKSAIPAAIAGVVIVAIVGVGIWFGTQGGNDPTTKDSSNDGNASRDFASRDNSSTRDSTRTRPPTKDTTPIKDGSSKSKDANTTNPTKDSTVNPNGTKDGVVKPPPVTIDPSILEPVKPVVTDVGIKPSEHWLAGKDVNLTEEDGKLMVFCIGKSPFIRCPKVPGPNRITTPTETAALQIRIRSSGEGACRLYWNTPDKPIWSEARSQAFVMKHDNKWHEHVIPIRSNAKQLELRIDLGEGAGIVEIDYIRYYLNIAKDPTPAAEWKFDSQPDRAE